MPFRYSGDTELLYTQYRDTGTDATLLAVPGESYDMEPIGSWAGKVAVPPADGRWDSGPEPPEPPGEPEPAAGDQDDSETASVPPPLVTGSSKTEDQED